MLYLIDSEKEERFFEEFKAAVTETSSKIGAKMRLTKATKNDKSINFLVYSGKDRDFQNPLREVYYDALAMGMADCARRYAKALESNEKFSPSLVTFRNGLFAKVVDKAYIQKNFPDACFIVKYSFAIVYAYQTDIGELILTAEDEQMLSGSSSALLMHEIFTHTTDMTFKVIANSKIAMLPIIPTSKFLKISCDEKNDCSAFGVLHLTHTLYSRFKRKMYILPVSTSTVYAIIGEKEEKIREAYMDCVKNCTEPEEERFSPCIYTYDRTGLNILE